MAEVSPVITTQTTMWKAWIGFNASHSYGAILYGLVYGYLALIHAQLLFGSTFLLGVGALLLVGYVFLGRRYFFSIPYRGILIATASYAAGLIICWTLDASMAVRRTYHIGSVARSTNPRRR